MIGISQKPLYDMIHCMDSRVLYTKGAFTPEQFCEGAKALYGGIEIYGRVHHGYGRWIPIRSSEGVYEGLGFDYPVDPKRGAFQMGLFGESETQVVAAS